MTKEIRKRIADEKLLLTYFSYPDCTVCKSLLPKVESLIKNFPDVSFQYVNTSEAQEIAGQYLVFTVPTIILFSGGREMRRFSRYISLDELEDFLRRIVPPSPSPL